MHFEEGQRVAYLYEKGYGKILSLKGTIALVADEDGFERTISLSELVYIHSDKFVKEDVIIEKAEEELQLTYRILQQRTGQKKPLTVWELDLHIEELLDSHRGMSNTEILLHQMNEFRKMFRKAQQQGIHKLIVIHGVGEGVLKSEIRDWLANQTHIEVYDADFSEYGKGATAVEFHPNWV